jgi:hypothetical protein
MKKISPANWLSAIVSPETVVKKIKSGMSIFLGNHSSRNTDHGSTSDEEGMRHLFYRFSDKLIYYRYFRSISSMPHAKMQEYVM